MFKTALVLAVLGLLAGVPSTASAQDGGKKKHGKRHEALLKKFDKDGDGKLNRAEKLAAREFHRQNGGPRKHHDFKKRLHRKNR